MKLIFFGCTSFSEKILNEVTKIKNIKVEAIFSIPSQFSISYSSNKVKNTNFVDLSYHAKKLNIPIYWIDGGKNKKINNYFNIINKIKPSIILVAGFYYMIPKKIRDLTKFGAWGIHASLLPNYAGGAPLVWAIIEGKKTTGVTLFKLSDGIDNGDIIAQSKFKIKDSDTIKDVYKKATNSSISIVKKTLAGDISNLKFKKQDQNKIKIYPQRSPLDGEINWDWNNNKIKNFIRAQSRPYPGAWTIINNKKITIWDAEINNYKKNNK